MTFIDGHMRRFDRRDIVIVFLAFLTLAQALFLGFGRRTADPWTGPWLQAGDSLSKVRALGSAGQKVSMATGEPTLLLVFNSDCGYCEDVAPLWKAWTTVPRQGLRAIAISSEPIPSAYQYALGHGWNAEVWTVVADILDVFGYALTRRTPWVFLLDGEGMILAEGHGSRIAEIAGNTADMPQGVPKP